MGVVIGLYGTMPPEKWWRLLGYEWSICDNIALYTSWLRPKFRRSRRLRLHMINPHESATYDSLPDVLTIYRGCYQNNRYGMSWTLDRDVAVKLPTMSRYRQNDHPLLLTARVPKSDCVYLGNEREERELVTATRGLWAATVTALKNKAPGY